MIIPIKSKGEIYNVLIDDEDYEKFSKHKWRINHCRNNKYCLAHNFINGKPNELKLHRFLMGLEKGDKRMINHKDGNGLNNTRSNLEICNNLYNSQSINTKRNFGCIIIEKNRLKKYRATVIINKKIYWKRFYTKEEAQAYLNGLKEIAKIETTPF